MSTTRITPTLHDGVTVEELEHLCIEFATKAARFIRDERPPRMGVAATKSTETDVVTVMDRRSEELLHRLIQQARPDDGILGEEGADVEGTSGLTWVVDPIDGTVNYLYEVPAYAVSVAVVVGDARSQGGWTPVAGAVADPCLRLVHHAGVGTGAWTRPEDQRADAAEPAARRLAASAEDRLGRTLLATGFGYAPEVRARQAEVLRRVLP
ncbi:MAG: inositol monophosphatase, partial [Terrabacter sp.]|nr:inositol monophosphatase [Terrabacter sp.]